MLELKLESKAYCIMSSLVDSCKLLENTTEVVKIITKQGNLFLKSDMFNLVTFTMIPGNVCSHIERLTYLARGFGEVCVH